MRDFDTAILENLYESVLSESVLDMALFKNLGFSEKNKSKKEILEYVKKYGPDIIIVYRGGEFKYLVTG